MTASRITPVSVAGELPLPYRPSIDGLRAIAILSVVLYHANGSWVPGGFIGVDVFFVISGFLISSLIFKELSQKNFTFVDFYARRIRRIFPALIVMMSATWVFGLVFLTSSEFVQLSKYVFAGGAFFANLLAWHQIGYFDTDAMQKPLLHLWSLGIEEQFYIIWPLLVVLLWKRPLFATTLSILLASFLFNIWRTPHHLSDTFYLPIGRAWELLLGSILAWIDQAARADVSNKAVIFPRINHAHLPKSIANIELREIAAFLATGLLALGLILIHPDSIFPGWLALAPTIATCLFIWAGEKAWINANILAHPMLVFVGLISYPLYIWHWPLLAILRIEYNGNPPLNAIIGAVVIALGSAVMTWRLIELPLRGSRHAPRIIVAILCAAMTVISMLGLLSFTHFIQTPRLARDEAEARKNAPRIRWDCSSIMDERAPGYEGCRIWVGLNLPKTIVIWGDSYAGSWEAGAEALARKRGARLVQFMYFGCPPLLNVRRTSQGIGKECNDFALANDTLRTIARLRPSLIIVTGRWTLYVDHLLGKGSYITSDPRNEATEETARVALSKGIPETLRRLTGIAKVLIIKGVPTLNESTESGLARDQSGFEPTLAQHRALNAIADSIIDQAAHDIPGVSVLDPAEILCDQMKCHAIQNGIRAYLPENTSHLSDAGSLLFLQKLEVLTK